MSVRLLPFLTPFSILIFARQLNFTSTKKTYFSGNLTAFISHGEDHRKIKKAGREAGLWFKKTIADVILSMSTSFLLVFSVTPFK